MSGFKEFSKREAEVMARPVSGLVNVNEVEPLVFNYDQVFVFDFEEGGLHNDFKVTVLKNGIPVDVAALTSDEKTQVIEMLTRSMASRAYNAWETAMGEDL